MLRSVAPAGTPVEITQVLRSAAAVALSAREDEELFQRLATRLKVRHVFGISSGRSALALILRGLSRLKPDHRVVAIPAYTCFTVPAAVVHARLKIHPVEIDPATLDCDPDGLENVPGDDLLCLVSSNLFGLTNDGARFRAAARVKGAFFIDDAAQALGASRNGCPAGTMGDAGFYSFGRGKALAAVEGGVIVTNSDDIAAAIREETQNLASSSVLHSAELLFQMLVYSVFLNPRLYWLPNSLPFLKLGSTEFNPAFRDYRMSALVRELLLRQMGMLDEFNRTRRENALVLAGALEGNSSFTKPRSADGCLPNYIRFPLIARDEATRDRAVRELRAAGIGAGPFYPSAVCDIEGIAPHMALGNFHCAKAEDLSRRLFTIPTHPYVQARDLHTVAEVLERF
ncbi:MAG: DegT/DnrJ/EryC1/StrS family aminotransferase [Acidobacteriia bacterium]|nr:DegT/DnrJ/EryC1/StrS family aminotransferase [Terriglobia bacterium]